jgi:uncharacterized membrane protein
MQVLVFALLAGIIAGLRTMIAPAAVSWAARLGWLDLAGTPVAFMGYIYAPYILTVFAIGELIADQIPGTPSRTVPVQFGARLVSGALAGACIGANADSLAEGLMAGAIGAVIGTLGGAKLRARLAAVFGKDRPAAWTENLLAIAGAFLIVKAGGA